MQLKIVRAIQLHYSANLLPAIFQAKSTFFIWLKVSDSFHSSLTVILHNWAKNILNMGVAAPQAPVGSWDLGPPQTFGHWF